MQLIKTYARVIGLLGPEKRLAVILAVSNLLLGCAVFVEPVLFGRIIDALTQTQTRSEAANWDRLLPLLGAWVGFGLFSIGAGVVIALYADRLAHRRRLSVITSYYEHVLQLPLIFHGTTHSGRLMKVMHQGADALWGLWLGFFREHLSALIGIVVLLPLSLYINWRLGLLLLILASVFVGLTSFVLRKTQALQEQVEDYYSDMAERTSDTLGNIALVQSYTRIEAEVHGLRAVADRLLAAQIPVLSWWAVVSVATRASITLTMLAIFLLGTALHFSGLATIGEIVTFMNFAGLLIGRLETVVGFINTIFMNAPKLGEFFEVLDTDPSVHDRPNAVDMPRGHGMVEFRDVSFSYDGKRPALIDLTFTAYPDETIALVGATGAGKSTALALLHRAFDPQSGGIFIDGVDIRDMTLASLRRNIAVVFQEALLFNRTIRENLLVGKPDATEDEMIHACQRAQALEFIQRQDHGFETVVGERGRSLSGGERQRLSIARALLKNPPLLILDEATSALDASTEIKVQAALDEVMKGRTTFVIAHRLSTIRHADKVLMFEGGQVIEMGSFDELVAREGRFAELAKAQFLVPSA